MNNKRNFYSFPAVQDLIDNDLQLDQCNEYDTINQTHTSLMRRVEKSEEG